MQIRSRENAIYEYVRRPLRTPLVHRFFNFRCMGIAHRLCCASHIPHPPMRDAHGEPPHLRITIFQVSLLCNDCYQSHSASAPRSY